MLQTPDAKDSADHCAKTAQFVLYSHPDFLLTLKPAGVSFHTEEDEPGFVARVKAATGEAGLHPVHRLDRITSGLVLFARHADAAREFGRMFEAGEISKCYLALSDYKPSKKQGWIKGAMLKARGGSWRLSREGDLRAATQFFAFSAGDGLRLFVLRPLTGRTHQLRVALKSLSAPILGDARYGGSPADRGYLHAYALRFTWQNVCFDFLERPIEGELFARIADQLTGKPWLLPWPDA
ncbi:MULTISPECIES: pseudouridine synthase [Uliginosibacterium]|uniref:RNA pseudouridine synthase n=1 Tax=Uliginosibacterium aquaticum TaxID=2731212 RepID=A0ABX2IG66_9RHOO|nr:MULTISPECIES: pseudouridine synthase [Uliginosibacterium]MDO6386242.1 pseudouridine synthase [Uliginosibacterium sp. 31-12]NSL53574.1 RNA pseudouridine synthase [Uliginosibacterium aquaticum]